MKLENWYWRPGIKLIMPGEIAKYFSVNESTVYRLIEERARTGSYETRTQLRGRKTILTEKQHHDILELVQEQPDIHNEGICEKHQMEAEFPNSQRNMLYRKRAFSGSCACTAADGKNTD